MTPDERLREAVLVYIRATREVGVLGSDKDREAFHRSHKALVDAFNCANGAANMKRDPRPCINAAVKVGGFWAGFRRGLCIVGDSRFFWWMSGMVLGAGLQGLFQ